MDVNYYDCRNIFVRHDPDNGEDLKITEDGKIVGTILLQENKISFFENLFDLVQKAEKYQENLEEESIKAESLNDEKLMGRALHGLIFSQKQAAYKEIKNRGYGNS